MSTASGLDHGTAGASARWSLRLFGGFELGALPGGKRLTSLGKRERVLLSYLALSPDHSQHRRKLATLLWGDSTDETALDNLRTCVWSLRKALGDAKHSFIVSEGERMVLDAASFDVDVLTFRRLASQSGSRELEAAGKLYSGELLEGLTIESEEFESWRRSESTRYRHQVMDVLGRLMKQSGERGETEAAIQAGTRILELEPLHEPAVRYLMRLYSESGRRGVAMQLYRTLADALRAELNTQPEAATRAVFTEISRADHPAPAQVAAPSKTHTGEVTIAVLPFANMSGDASQEFFSDGMTEEITSALAKAPKLQVIARTSAFQFKGQNQDVRTVGQTLGVSHLIEGSVRRAGDRVRISAQLIHAGDGVHLWSESYDRQITDIFAIQEEIARAIAAALRAPLGLEPGERLVPNRTADLESYQQYLVARGLYRARGAGVGQAIAILEPLVMREPGYAPAWALLARCYSLVPVYSPVTFGGLVEEARRTWQNWLAKMETAGRRATHLDPKHADGYVALASIQTMTGKWEEAEDLLNQALKLDPDDPEALHYYSVMLTYVGKCKAAMAMRERLRTLDPLVPVYDIVTAYVMWIVGQKTAALSVWEAIPPDALGGFYRNVCLAGAYAAFGRFAEAADTILQITGSQVSRRSVEEAARLIRTPTTTDAPDALPKLEGDLNFVYMHVGAPDRLMEFAERNLAIGWVGSTANYPIWTSEHVPLRKTERFKSYVRAAGMVDYWRARGWPDLCHASGTGDFACE
jgi:TolB-like protein